MHRLALTVLLSAALLVAPIHAQSPGPVVAVGGGGTTPAIVARTLALAGGPRAVVAVLPQASAVANAGDGSVKMWSAAGAATVHLVSFDNRDSARAMLTDATLIWMPGGSQSRFMEQIAGTGLAEMIVERHRAGAVVGGTSAGAAVLSDAMITGEADLKSLTSGKTVLKKGLGLLRDVIVDSAVVFQGSSMEVLGKSAVVVVDPRPAARETFAAGQVVAATGLRLSVLREGMSYSLR